jgi:Zn finger protein HypA/HybF involved in hydrogenase expression
MSSEARTSVNHDIDPYTPEVSTYECQTCSHRVTVEGHQGACPECGGTVKNIAVPRE